MHTCLKVDEILRLIAYELVPPGIIIGAERRATAVALACCRQGFEDPVLDVLWESQHRLIPLLKTLPEDVWNERECTHLRRPPTTLELTRFQKYTRRMREFRDIGSLHGLPPEMFLVLQRLAFSEPLLPNLKTFRLWSIIAEFVPLILLFVSPRTTSIDIGFDTFNLPKPLFASTIAILPTRCPSLQHIGLQLPRDPMVTATVSEFLLTTNRNTLRSFYADSPLTKEAREVISKLPDLRRLMVVTEKDTSLPSLVLPSLTHLVIKGDHDGGLLQMFHGATLKKLESVSFFVSEQIGDLLGAFGRVALALSVQNTLSEFCLYTACSWNPTYSSLLPFTQLTCLFIESSCDGGCSSRVDDDIIINLARSMPKLEMVVLGDEPCSRIPTGVTARGLVALAHHCPNLSLLRVHFHVATLSALPPTVGVTSNPGSTALAGGCALADLEVGDIPMPKQSVLMVAVTLVRIFPHIEGIDYTDEGWGEVMDAINHSRQIIGYSSKEHHLTKPQSNLNDASLGATPGSATWS
ncbi:hypothetical protein BDM02DRAFT_1744661 [Thelephora ganbajun]|uniref:Uncharacterized protein n=1 Tax=Thelephora ganbajun TaxID=370292 RepID=A0ACB6Z0X4_THEGA|nr:hypothetical protein BDM02DRAFT_1744661 [Thelephora ganbajun]